jgi:hypothetical protein
MGGIIKKDFKYKIINNFLSKDEIILLNQYCVYRHRNNINSFDIRMSPNGDTFFINDPLMESILKIKTSLVENESGLKLFPTYTYWRMYTYGSSLKKHRDRPSCEISLTIKIGSDGTKWPIFVDGTPIELNDGDALLYSGCEVLHWREKFNGDWNSQVFIHYVDKNGLYKDMKFDCRPDIGLHEKYRNDKLKNSLMDHYKNNNLLPSYEGSEV